MSFSTRKKYFAIITASSILIVIYFIHFNKTDVNFVSTFIKHGQNIVPRNLAIDSSLHTKLIVFDSTNYSGNLEFLNNPPTGWSVVVSNIQNVNQIKSCKQCIYVTQSWAESYLQSSWMHGLETWIKIKMATFLFLMSMKTEWIYVTNKAQKVPYKALSRVTDNEFSKGLVYTGPGDVFEPCHHFVDPVTWQGGSMPIGPPSHYGIGNVSRHSIYYVVDECFHDNVIEDRWKISLDQRAPIPFVMSKTFAVLDFSNVLVSRETMWTLIAALTNRRSPNSKSRLQSLKLNLAVQRILWETNNQIGFLPGEAQQKKCSVCTISSDIGILGKEFREMISKSTCESTRKLPICLTNLVEKIIEDEYTVSAFRLWFEHPYASFTNHILRHPLRSENLSVFFSERKIFFTPAKLLRIRSDNDTLPPNPLSKICQKNGLPYKPFIPYTHSRPDSLILIIINDGKYVNQIPFMEYIYGRYFSHIIYCSTKIDLFVQLYQEKNPKNPVSFITMPHHVHTQVFMAGVVTMNYDVTGYFQFSDDVLVNLWNYQSVPINQPWFQSFIGVGHITDKYFTPGNGGRKDFVAWNYYKKQMRMAWDYLQRMRYDTIHGKRVSKFLKKIAKGTNCSDCIYFGNADIFYIPQHIGEGFTFFAEIFDSFPVQFELAIINIIGGLVRKRDIYGLSGKYIWGSMRNRFKQYFSENEQFYHAFKYSKLRDPNWAEFYCDHYLHNLDVHLKQGDNHPDKNLPSTFFL